MALWTVSWQVGSGGERVASLVADRVGVDLVDSDSLASTVQRMLEREEPVGGVVRWLTTIGLAVGPMFGATRDLVTNRGDRPDAQELFEYLIVEAARSSCVVADCSAFALLADHPRACHVRIRAPLSWRVRRYAREECVPLDVARHALVRLERRHQIHVLRRYRRRLDSPANFSVVCDASRYQLDDLVDLLVLAGEPTLPPRAVASRT